LDLLIERYATSFKGEWDAFAQASKNGTFLFTRDFMEYHSDRFDDHSLIVRRGAEILALLPANSVGAELHSHQGLTYGGLVMSASMTTPDAVAVFDSLLAHLRREGFHRVHYKTMPSIYHRIPAEEDLYALFLADAMLSRRDVLSVVPLGRRGPVQSRRRRGASKAAKQGVLITEAEHFGAYWGLLTRHLQERYGVDPVHALDEIELLRRRFPDAIKLFEARIGVDVIAGVVIFESPMVAHVQYIAASMQGREASALDAIFQHLLENVFDRKPYFDFGISNEQAGRYLNHGLIEQKEGFGARTVVHDHYVIELTS
jgi:hypothetical protein